MEEKKEITGLDAGMPEQVTGGRMGTPESLHGLFRCSDEGCGYEWLDSGRGIRYPMCGNPDVSRVR